MKHASTPWKILNIFVNYGQFLRTENFSRQLLTKAQRSSIHRRASIKRKLTVEMFSAMKCNATYDSLSQSGLDQMTRKRCLKPSIHFTTNSRELNEIKWDRTSFHSIRPGCAWIALWTMAYGKSSLKTHFSGLKINRITKTLEADVLHRTYVHTIYELRVRINWSKKTSLRLLLLASVSLYHAEIKHHSASYRLINDGYLKSATVLSICRHKMSTSCRFKSRIN